MKKLIILMSLIITQLASANCLESYDKIIHDLKVKKTKESVASTSIMIGTLLFPPAAIINIISYGARGALNYQYAKHHITQENLEYVREVIKEAKIGEGKRLDRILTLINTDRDGFTKEDLAKEITVMNESGLYCGEDEIADIRDLLIMSGANPESVSLVNIGIFGELRTNEDNEKREITIFAGH